MTTVTPPTPPPPVPPANVPRGLPTLTVQTPPPGLAELPTGTRIEGTVVVDGSEGSKATVQIQTNYGTLTVQTALPLSRGAELNLILTTVGSNLALLLAAIDGKAPHVALRAANFMPPPGTSGAGAAQGTAQGPAAAGAAGPATLVGTTVPATFVRPAPFLAAPGPGSLAPPLAPGSGAPPAGTPTAFGTQAMPGAGASAPGGGAPAGPAAPGTAPVAGMPPVVPGTRIAVQVASVIEAGRAAVQTAVTPPSAPVGLAVGHQVSAVVTGVATTGQPVVQTPLGILSLATDASLPRGTELVLRIAGPPSAATAGTAEPAPATPFALFRGPGWPTLDETLQALGQASPPTHDAVIAALPQANAHLSNNILFFLSALRGGDVSSWLGDQAIRILSRDRPHLVTRLGEEFRHISAMSHEPVAGDWRIALVPFFHQQQLEQLRLYLKPYGGDEDEDSGPEGTRFIIDVDLSNLGRMQFDGLVRDDHKRLDLIVRSHEPLPRRMQDDIRTIFEEANELTGVVGGLTFQAAPPNFVDIAPRGGGGGSDVIA